MPTVQVLSDTQIDLDKILDSVGQLDLAEMERFAFKVSSLVARRKAPSLPKREAELLQQINLGIPLPVRSRYEALNQKLLEKTLTTEEHKEFSNIVDQIERFDVERLKHLIELAQLRGVSIDQLMSQLGIRRKHYG